MNIFEVLSEGSSRLHEVSMSALLGYLLSPHKDHGLQKVFFDHFIQLCFNDRQSHTLHSKVIDHASIIDVDLELGYKSIRIDIMITISDESNQEICKVIIENKINNAAIRDDQILKYYNTVKESEAGAPIIVVLVTPQINSTSSRTIEKLRSRIHDDDHCAYVPWHSNHSEDISIDSIIKAIVRKDVDCDINPVAEYTLHTLKAFSRHITSHMSPRSRSRRISNKKNIGDIICEKEVTIGNRQYLIIRRDSSQIQIKDLQKKRM